LRSYLVAAIRFEEIKEALRCVVTGVTVSGGR